MNKIIVTLRSSPTESIEVPNIVKYKGDKEETVLQKSCTFGAIRLFAGIPKTISMDELKHIKKVMPRIYSKLDVKPYVESKRVDKRGASESEINKLVVKEGLEHLKPAVQIEKLKERGLIKKPKKAKPLFKQVTKEVKLHKKFKS